MRKIRRLERAEKNLIAFIGELRELLEHERQSRAVLIDTLDLLGRRLDAVMAERDELRALIARDLEVAAGYHHDHAGEG